MFKRIAPERPKVQIDLPTIAIPPPVVFVHEPEPQPHCETEVDVEAPPEPASSSPPSSPVASRPLLISSQLAIGVGEQIVETVPVESFMCEVTVERDLLYAALVTIPPSPSFGREHDAETREAMEALHVRLIALEREARTQAIDASAIDGNRLVTEMRIAIIGAANRIIAPQHVLLDCLSGQKPITLGRAAVQPPPNSPAEQSPRPGTPTSPRRATPTSPGRAVQLSLNRQPDIVLRTIVPAIYERPPPTSVVIDVGESPAVDVPDDPCTSSIALLAQATRWLETFGDNAGHINRTLKNDGAAYDAFLAASRMSLSAPQPSCR
jgi:hypothetical protein